MTFEELSEDATLGLLDEIERGDARAREEEQAFLVALGRVPAGVDPLPLSARDKIKERLFYSVRNKPPEATVIYFIQAKRLGLIKIGRANRIMARLQDLQCGSPDELLFLWGFWARPSAEAELHRYFHRERVRGEWFEPSDDLLNYIRSHPRGVIQKRRKWVR